MIDTLLIGGRGTIGSGLRTYLPKLNSEYRITSVDLPGAEDRAVDPDAHRTFVDLDASTDDAGLRDILEGRDLVVYLARKTGLGEMNAMTDLVFGAVMDVCPDALMIGSSSVHATGGAYFPFEKEPYATIAARRFEDVDPWPDPLPATLEPCPTGDYGLAKVGGLRKDELKRRLQQLNFEEIETEFLNNEAMLGMLQFWKGAFDGLETLAINTMMEPVIDQYYKESEWGF